MMAACPECGLSLAGGAGFCSTCGWQSAAPAARAVENDTPDLTPEAAPFPAAEAETKPAASTIRVVLGFLIIPIVVAAFLVGLTVADAYLPFWAADLLHDRYWRGVIFAVVMAAGVTVVEVFSPAGANRLDNAELGLRFGMGNLSQWYQWEMGSRFWPTVGVVGIWIVQAIVGLVLYAVIRAFAL